jgi:ABC-type uncharacterized transport system ATPase subunit
LACSIKAIAEHCDKMIRDFDVRPADPALRIALLSGGNQQKVVMAREMAASPKLILVGQPTRGVDIGTIESLHARRWRCVMPVSRFCWYRWNWKKCAHWQTGFWSCPAAA